MDNYYKKLFKILPFDYVKAELLQNTYKNVEKLLTKLLKILYSINVADRMCAALAQSVERRLGKAEVTGSNPVSSLIHC